MTGVRRLGLVAVGMAMVAGCRSPKKRVERAAAAVKVAAVPQGKGPQIADCPVFPADNVWNTPVDALPRDPRSDAYVDSIGVTERLHADFGSSMSSEGNIGATWLKQKGHTDELNTEAYIDSKGLQLWSHSDLKPREAAGIPVTIIGDGKVTRTEAKVRFRKDAESDDGMYPVFSGMAIEAGGGAADGRRAVMIDPNDCSLYELRHLSFKRGGANEWTAESGVKMDLRSDALRPPGLALLPGLVRYDEVQAGEIDHAMRFTISIDRIQQASVWPVWHSAASIGDSNLPPLGTRLRLRADFDVSRFPPDDRVILTALKKYGMILADGGEAIYLSGSPDARWDDTDLHKLSQVKGEDFEVVDESGLMVGKDSGAVKMR